MLKSILFISFIILLICNSVIAESKVLKRYVEKFEEKYKWTLNATYDVDNSKVFVLELVSQEWLPNESDTKFWKHWLTICKPNNYSSTHKTGLLFVDNGYNTNWQVPTVDKLNAFGGMLCSSSNEITATLLQVPNQYIMFKNDSVLRKEDDIVAYTWRRFMDTKDPTWISLLPQTKSATAAMDAVEEFGKTATGNYTITKFVVTGASKRGWTAFGAAIADKKRVIAIAPMVIPILNIVENIVSQKAAYSEFSFALTDYMNHEIPSFLYTKYFKKLAKIIDPINYLNTLKNTPKYIIVASSDEFFLPDATKYFYDKLKGEKRLGVYSATNHGGILKLSVAQDISKFFKLVANKIERPDIKWSITYSSCKNYGTIKLNVVKGVATKITVWSATTISTTKRDFRMFTCPTAACLQNINWISQDVTIVPNNTYTITMEKPAAGWTAFFFTVDFAQLASFSTEVAVVPDIYPFPTCSQSECGSGKPSYVLNKKVSDDDDEDDEQDFEDDESDDE